MSRTLPDAAANVPHAACTAARTGDPSLFSDLVVLTKARLTMMVLITTLVGFCMASTGRLDWLLLFHTLLGTIIVAGSSQVLNQVVEAEVDQLMDRTRDRPLPAGRLDRTKAAFLGFGLAVAGVFYLAITVNALTAYLSAATIIIYIMLYTPLKRRTPLCITIGAIAGAIPPVIGWSAVRHSLDFGAWILFGILFLWQMPHFLAIAWMYRDEYANAGFVMLRPKDKSGILTSLESLAFTVALAAVSLVPLYSGGLSFPYLIGATLCNVMMIVLATRFVGLRSRARARALFFASLVFLPVLLSLMVFTRK